MRKTSKFRTFCSLILGLTMILSILNVADITVNAYLDNVYVSTDGSWAYSVMADDTVEIYNEELSFGAIAPCSAYLGGENAITIPEEIDGYTVTSIGDSAFAGIENIDYVVIPSTVTHISPNAFENCPDIVICGENGSYAAKFAAENCIGFFTTETKPYDYVILDNDSIEIMHYRTSSSNVLIPSTIDGFTVTSIGAGAFYGKTKIKKIIVPNTVTSIEASAFQSCLSLESITIPSSVTYIGDYAFAEDESLTEISIPDSVTEIGSMAFGLCMSLTEVHIPDSVDTIGEAPFAYCMGLSNIYVDISNNAYMSKDGVLFDKEQTQMICYPVGKEDPYYAVPDGVNTISSHAFSYSMMLSEVEIPDSVTEIDANAFEYCASLERVTLPNSITSIKEMTFYGCGSLESIEIPNGVTEIEESAFGECASLTDVVIPDSVTHIGSDAFSYCYSLESVTIPESVTSFGYYVFNESPMVTVYGYEDTETEKYAIDNNVNFIALTKSLIGDIDGNGQLDYNDYAMVITYIYCHRSLFEPQSSEEYEFKKNADVNGDGVIDAFDAIEIDLRINGIIFD